MRIPVRQYDSADAALRSHACTLASLAWIAGWATDGAELPAAQAARDDLMNRLQRLSGATRAEFLARGTTLTEAERAYEALTFTDRLPPRMRLMHGGSVRDDLLPELRAGNVALIAVNYGAIQDAGKAIGSFRGGHAVVVGEPDAGSVAVADPLRSGVVRWSIDLLVKAMETFGSRPWGNGRGEAGVVSLSPTYKQAYTESQVKLAEARTIIDRRTAMLDAQKAQTTLATEERDTARREVTLARTTADELSASLVAANKRITDLINGTPPDCAVAVTAERDRVLDAIRVKVEELV